MILVTGANGTTGGATLRALCALDTPVRVLVRDPSSFVAPPGVEVAVGRFEDPDSLDAALASVDSAYLVSPSSERQVAQETAFVEAAVRARLTHLVRLSAPSAAQPDVQGLRFGRLHQRLEQTVRDAGIPWTFLRPNAFMQNYLGQAAAIAGQGVFYSSLSPAAKLAYIDAEDIGAVAAKTLTEPGHAGHAYPLDGPAALSDDDVAARLSAVLGREITHVQVPLEATRQAMRGTGYPAWSVDGFVELFALYETGVAAGVSPDIARILGRPARGFDDFARDHRAAFGG